MKYIVPLLFITLLSGCGDHDSTNQRFKVLHEQSVPNSRVFKIILLEDTTTGKQILLGEGKVGSMFTISEDYNTETVVVEEKDDNPFE